MGSIQLDRNAFGRPTVLRSLTRSELRKGEIMNKFTVHGSFEDPKRAKSYARFTSKEDYATEEGAIKELEKWTQEARYEFIWIEEAKR